MLKIISVVFFSLLILGALLGGESIGDMLRKSIKFIIGFIVIAAIIYYFGDKLLIAYQYFLLFALGFWTLLFAWIICSGIYWKFKSNKKNQGNDSEII